MLVVVTDNLVTGMLVMGSRFKEGRRVTQPACITDLQSSKLDNPWCPQKNMDENTVGFLWEASKLVARSSVLQCHYL